MDDTEVARRAGLDKIAPERAFFNGDWDRFHTLDAAGQPATLREVYLAKGEGYRPVFEVPLEAYLQGALAFYGESGNRIVAACPGGATPRETLLRGGEGAEILLRGERMRHRRFEDAVAQGATPPPGPSFVEAYTRVKIVFGPCTLSVFGSDFGFFKIQVKAGGMTYSLSARTMEGAYQQILDAKLYPLPRPNPTP